MISTIYKVTEDELEVLRIRKHPGRKVLMLKGLILFLNEKEICIPIMVDDYNHCKVGVDTHDQY
jgi:hypothetical protein